MCVNVCAFMCFGYFCVSEEAMSLCLSVFQSNATGEMDFDRISSSSDSDSRLRFQAATDRCRVMHCDKDGAIEAVILDNIVCLSFSLSGCPNTVFAFSRDRTVDS